MSTDVRPKRYTLEEYLEMEYRSNRRHYFYDGIVSPMTYTSDNHGLIVTNLIGELHAQAKGTDFRIYPSDRMLYVPACRLNYYPDVMIVKGEPVFHRHTEKMYATLNPYALIEVLSPSTETQDRFDKWPCYRRIESLQQYVLVAQDRVYFDIYNRVGQTDTWENTYLDDLSGSLRIAGFDIQVHDVYHHVKFE